MRTRWLSVIVAVCQALVQDIVFPLMCHTDDDEELWESDPVEYIRVKYGSFLLHHYIYMSTFY